MDNQLDPQPAVNIGTYAAPKMTPNNIQILVTDDSPDAAVNAFWEFLGIEIPIANIQENDFAVIMDMVDRSVQDYIMERKVEDWDKITFQEVRKREIEVKKCGNCGAANHLDVSECMNCGSDELKADKVMVSEVVREWKLPMMWDKLEAKVYEKLCRARGGFTFLGLTEDRSMITQEMRQNVPTMQQQQKKKRRWF